MNENAGDQQQALVSYLGNAPYLVDFRRAMLASAFEEYQEQLREPTTGSSLAGAGLLVLERALVIAEDFAALLRARQGSSHWRRLTSYTTKDISNFLRDYFERRPEIDELVAFPMLSARQLAALSSLAEESWSDLLTLHRRHIASVLETLAVFWLAHVDVGKGAFHGFCFMSEDQVRRQAVAGPFGEYVDYGGTPFALAFASEVDHGRRMVNTKITPVALDERNVMRVYSAAMGATYGSLVHAAGWVCELRVDEVPLPMPVLKALFLVLPPRKRDALGELAGPWM